MSVKLVVILASQSRHVIVEEPKVTVRAAEFEIEIVLGQVIVKLLVAKVPFKTVKDPVVPHEIGRAHV